MHRTNILKGHRCTVGLEALLRTHCSCSIAAHTGCSLPLNRHSTQMTTSRKLKKRMCALVTHLRNDKSAGIDLVFLVGTSLRLRPPEKIQRKFNAAMSACPHISCTSLATMLPGSRRKRPSGCSNLCVRGNTGRPLRASLTARSLTSVGKLTNQLDETKQFTAENIQCSATPFKEVL